MSVAVRTERERGGKRERERRGKRRKVDNTKTEMTGTA